MHLSLEASGGSYVSKRSYGNGKKSCRKRLFRRPSKAGHYVAKAFVACNHVHNWIIKHAGDILKTTAPKGCSESAPRYLLSSTLA